MYSRSMHRESKTHLCSCTHTYTHPLNSLCTRNHHSFTAIPVELASFRSFSSHDRFLSIYYNKIVVPKRVLSACLSICRSIQLLSALVPLVYLFVDTFTNLLMTSIWSPRIVFVSLKFLRTISNRSFHCTITGHKSTKYKKPILLEVFLSFFLVFRRCMKIDRRGVFREGNHQFLESYFLESWC